MTLAGLLVAACGGQPNRLDDEPEQQAIARTQETTTTTPSDDEPRDEERQAVIDSYLAAVPAFIEAALVPDPHYPLEETHTGPYLQGTRELLEDMAARGVPLAAPENPEVREVVTSVRFGNDDPDFAHVDAREVALIEVCTADFYAPMDPETGLLTGDHSVMTVWSKAAMVKEDGVWKLADQQQTREPVLDVDQCPGGS